MILLAALALSLAILPDEPWTSVRSDDGRRAVFLKTYGGDAEMPKVGGHIYLAPGPRWPRRRNYDIWLVNYDCEARTRTNNARITYSSWRDPQRVLIDPPRIDDETNPAVADQLALICDHRDEGRVSYRTFEDFLSDRPLR